jgi:hypothetical protein
MRTSIERITPDMAKVMLGTNTMNRVLRPRRVRLYAEQMRRGQWQATGEAIKFAKDGTLLDGQHRLQAVIESGTAIEVLVVRELDLSTFKVIDSGLTRTPGDVMQTLGVTFAGHKASATRMIVAIEAGLGCENEAYMSELVTKTDIADYIMKNRELIDAAHTAARNVYSNCRGSLAAWMTLYVMIARKHSQVEAELFLQSIASGASLDNGDPRLALRNWAIRHSATTTKRGEHIQAYTRAWNAYRAGETMHLLRVPSPAHRRVVSVI